MDHFEHGREFSVSCNFCGYYHINSIERFVGTTEIYHKQELFPMGVVITVKGNIQYFSVSQRDSIIKEYDAAGYTSCHENKWTTTNLKNVTIKSKELLWSK